LVVFVLVEFVLLIRRDDPNLPNLSGEENDDSLSLILFPMNPTVNLSKPHLFTYTCSDPSKEMGKYK
jgi:hypothetical protein